MAEETRLRCERCGQEWAVAEPDTVTGHLCTLTVDDANMVDREPAPVTPAE
jgi:hypothetical protein